MCHRYFIEAVDHSLRDGTKWNKQFGGKCPLFSGDFRKTLPVIQGGTRGQILRACVTSSALHAHFRILRLTENMLLASLRNEPNASSSTLLFPGYFPMLGEGRLGTCKRDMVDLHESVEKAFSFNNLCSTVFNGIESYYSDVDWLTSKNQYIKEQLQVEGDK